MEPLHAAEVNIQLPMNSAEETPASAIPSTTTMHAVISVTTKADNNNEESKHARVVTFEVPPSETLTKVPVVEEVAQVAPAA